MQEEENRVALLAPYRALDITDEKGLMCGKILADMGADVIKVEKPGGDLARRIGPFYHDDPNPEKSLYWFAYNTNKRGITLDIETSDGQDIFKQLVKTADFVIESFDPGYMSSLGLGYADLEKINPRIIMVSITPFGQSGPYVEQGYKVNDMIVWALGGHMWLTGDPDRPPNQVTFPQAYLHGGGEAASDAMIALYSRGVTGEGQHVDVSIQQCIPIISMNAIPYWDFHKIVLPRGIYKRGIPRPDGSTFRAYLFWPCKDGTVYYMIGGGALKSMVTSSIEFVKLMDEEGMAGDLKDYDWTAHDTSTVSQEQEDHIREVVARYLMKHTKAELYEEAIKRKLVLAPIQDPKDVAENPQLRAREFFVEVGHPELGDTLTYCGPWAQLSETPLAKWQRAPLIGEHNQEVYEKELGLTGEQLISLKQANTI